MMDAWIRYAMGVSPKVIGYIAVGWVVVIGMFTITCLIEPIENPYVLALLVCAVAGVLVVTTCFVMLVFVEVEKGKKGEVQ